MKKVYLVLLLILIVFSVGLFYTNLKAPIKIALLGKFEEERYDFVTSSVIAARISEKEINDKQGIRGQNVELVIKDDDFSNPEATIEYLLKNKIEAIITTATSEEIVKLKPYLDKNKIVCISVFATSSTLNNKNDYIYRILPDDSNEVKTLFDYLNKNNIKKDFAVIYSNLNNQYKDSVIKNIENLNGKVSFEESFGDYSLNYTPSNIDAVKNKTVVILASARDTALILQRLNHVGIVNNIFGLDWSGDKNLIYYGGKSVENFKFITPANLTKTGGKYGEFTQMLKQYNQDNGLIPYGVYNAFAILKKGYEDKYKNHITLKEAIDRNHTFQDIDGKFIYNNYGDVQSEEYIFTAKGSEFIKIGGSSDESAKN
jgi:branched-chain amino acid transport system substrate-binding protein